MFLSVLGCLFSAVLLVTVVSDDDTTKLAVALDGAHLSGLCLAMRGPPKANWELEGTMLAITYLSTTYLIPLPQVPGQWPLDYTFGEAQATLGDWGRVQVRRPQGVT